MYPYPTSGRLGTIPTVTSTSWLSATSTALAAVSRNAASSPTTQSACREPLRSHDKYLGRRDEAVEAVHGLLEQRRLSGKREHLLRRVRRGKGPEPCSRTAGQDSRPTTHGEYIGLRLPRRDGPRMVGSEKCGDGGAIPA